jgi:hypothetical protein
MQGRAAPSVLRIFNATRRSTWSRRRSVSDGNSRCSAAAYGIAGANAARRWLNAARRYPVASAPPRACPAACNFQRHVQLADLIKSRIRRVLIDDLTSRGQCNGLCCAAQYNCALAPTRLNLPICCSRGTDGLAPARKFGALPAHRLDAHQHSHVLN